jgi:hypothetical protein
MRASTELRTRALAGTGTPRASSGDALLLALSAPAGAISERPHAADIRRPEVRLRLHSRPIGGGRTTSYTLSWDPATDNLSPARRIGYDVYRATTAGGEDFATPTYTTEPGATWFATPELPTDEVFCFVVRARDQAGNRDSPRCRARDGSR